MYHVALCKETIKCIALKPWFVPLVRTSRQWIKTSRNGARRFRYAATGLGGQSINCENNIRSCIRAPCNCICWEKRNNNGYVPVIAFLMMAVCRGDCTLLAFEVYCVEEFQMLPCCTIPIVGETWFVQGNVKCLFSILNARKVPQRKSSSYYRVRKVVHVHTMMISGMINGRDFESCVPKEDSWMFKGAVQSFHVCHDFYLCPA